MRAMFKKPFVRLAVLGVALLGSAAIWYLIAPLFTGPQAYSIFPTLAMMPSATPRPATATPLPTQTVVPTETSAVSLSVQADLMAVGEFYDVTHEGSGIAGVYRTEDGGLVLTLQNFEVEDGPELRLFIADEAPITEDNFTPADGLDLGLLASLSGDQLYYLPADIDLADYQSVLVWCESYDEPFIAAALGSPEP